MSELTPEMLGDLYDAPWPATKEQLIDYARRNGCPSRVIEALESLESGREYDVDYFDDELLYGDDEDYCE